MSDSSASVSLPQSFIASTRARRGEGASIGMILDRMRAGTIHCSARVQRILAQPPDYDGHTDADIHALENAFADYVEHAWSATYGDLEAEHQRAAAALVAAFVPLLETTGPVCEEHAAMAREVSRAGSYYASRSVALAAKILGRSAGGRASLNRCVFEYCTCTAATSAECTPACQTHDHEKRASVMGSLVRSADGKLLARVLVSYNGKNLFNGAPKQLSIGSSGAQLKIGKTAAADARIPACILNAKGTNKDTFQRQLLAYDKDGGVVKLATISRGEGGKTVTTTCSNDELGSVVRLGFGIAGSRVMTPEKEAALKLFSITLAPAPAAANKEGDEEEAGDEDDEIGGNE